VSEPVTLITGTRKGIGRSLAGHYLSRGHRVYGCSRQDSGIADANYRHFGLDVTDEKEVRRMFSEFR
jgi:3-oxoacyl-[acyl-carrier protein] reductase